LHARPEFPGTRYFWPGVGDGDGVGLGVCVMPPGLPLGAGVGVRVGSLVGVAVGCVVGGAVVGDVDGFGDGVCSGGSVGSGDRDGSPVGALVGAPVGAFVGVSVGRGCGVSNAETTPTWTTALAPRSPIATTTQRPWATGISVQVGLAPLVLMTPVQLPCSVNVPLKFCSENVTGTGDDETLLNCTFAGDATTGAGRVSCGGFVGMVDGTGVGDAAVAATATTANQ